MRNPNRFPSIRILQTPVIFQVQENYPTSFNQEAIQVPPLPTQTYSSIYLLPPLVLTNQFALPSNNRQGIPKYHTTPRICVGQRINLLIFVIWPVRHKNSLKSVLTKTKPSSVDIKILSLFLANDNQRPVVIKILSNHFWPTNEIQVSDFFNNVFLRPRTPGWPSCHTFFMMKFYLEIQIIQIQIIIISNCNSPLN